jgi:hypothetical protein
MGSAKKRLTTPTPEQRAGAARRASGLGLRPPGPLPLAYPPTSAQRGSRAGGLRGRKLASRKSHLAWVWREIDPRPRRPNSGPHAPLLAFGGRARARAPPDCLPCSPTSAYPCAPSCPPGSPAGLPIGSGALLPPFLPAPRRSSAPRGLRPLGGGRRPLEPQTEGQPGGTTRPGPTVYPSARRHRDPLYLPRHCAPTRPRAGRVPGLPCAALPYFLTCMQPPPRSAYPVNQPARPYP